MTGYKINFTIDFPMLGILTLHRRFMGLLIGRKVGESILIDKNIEVSVREIKGNHYVKLEVECPREIPVYRKELKLNEEQE